MLILIPIVIILVVLLRSPVIKGMIRESIVRLIIGNSSEKPGKEKFVIHNFLMQLDNGKTSQTDHILINHNGVFVIETKNYSGRIYGDDMQQEWTQVLNYGKVKNKFYSPVKQNGTHIYYIKKLLPANTPIYSAIVFVKGNIGYIKSKYVYNLWGLLSLISTSEEHKLSIEDMQLIHLALSKNNKSHEISNLEHVTNLREIQFEIANNICPRCHGTLVERKGKYGTFFGCSNYPNCRFIKKI